jgi:hypothetical protein
MQATQLFSIHMVEVSLYTLRIDSHFDSDANQSSKGGEIKMDFGG